MNITTSNIVKDFEEVGPLALILREFKTILKGLWWLPECDRLPECEERDNLSIQPWVLHVPMVELTDCPSLLDFVLLAPMISVTESGCFHQPFA